MFTFNSISEVVFVASIFCAIAAFKSGRIKELFCCIIFLWLIVTFG